MVLADGMGGYQAGEVASGMATTQISEGLGMAWTLARPEKLSRQQSKAVAEKLMREQIAKARMRAVHDLKIADNTYETVEASVQMRNLMKESASSFDRGRPLGIRPSTAPSAARSGRYNE